MGLEEKLPSGIVLTSVEKVVNWSRKSSLWPATFGLACCAIEMMSTGMAHNDLDRFGARFGLCRRYANEPWHFELRPRAVDHGCPDTYADPTHDPRLQR